MYSHIVYIIYSFLDKTYFYVSRIAIASVMLTGDRWFFRKMSSVEYLNMVLNVYLKYLDLQTLTELAKYLLVKYFTRLIVQH